MGQWVGAPSHTPKGYRFDLIPGQGTYVGCGVNPLSGCVWEETDVSLSHLPLSLKSINISSGEDSKKKRWRPYNLETLSGPLPSGPAASHPVTLASWSPVPTQVLPAT